MRIYQTLRTLIAGAAGGRGTLAAQTNIFPAAGNVGIGTASPGAKLSVVGGGGGTIDLVVNGRIQTGDASGAGGIWLNSAQTAFVGDVGGASPGFYNYAVGWGFVMRPNGNVGIGTTNPGTKVEVVDSGGTYQIGTNSVYWSGFKTTAPTGIWGFQQSERAFFGLAGNIYGRGFSANAIAVFNGSATAEDVALYNRNGSDAGVLVLKASGNVGIGTAAPGAKLDVAGNILLSGGRSTILTTGDNTTTDRGGIQFVTYDNGTTNIWTPTDQGGYPKDSTIRLGGFGSFNSNTLNLAVSGAMGIGTTTMTEKLNVNGRIRAKEVIVETNWSDFVFDPGYRLTPLAQVEQQIRTEKHLPGIPSAQEVASGGVSIGDMQAKLLQKIEELTLHVIEQQKLLVRQEDRIRRLETQNLQLSRTSPP